jgi:tRNA G18 (ribose-2'-O)-methylase SpoU
MRSETRLERYNNKLVNSVKLPLSIVTVNFLYDDNLAFLIRAGACFGVENIYVIGGMPPRNVLNPKSGSLYDFVNIKIFKNPSEFLKFSRENNINLISAELDDESGSLYDFRFDFKKNNAIVLGHEMTGIPVEILMNSSKLFIPMPGPGYSLNTSQAGNIMAYEFSRQYSLFSRE